MHICLLMDNPETPRHPVLSVALETLQARHTVRLLDVAGISAVQGRELESREQPADLYLLKSHTPQALELARMLESQGRRIMNSWSASRACQDRVLTTGQMHAANLPWPQTRAFATLADALNAPAELASFSWPLIIKSRYSQRGDLIVKLDEPAQFQTLATQWSHEPVIVQEFVAGDGWDRKLWVIDQRVFAARRRSPLETGVAREDVPLTDSELPVAWKELALAIGQTFGMQIYGVDLLLTEKGPLPVDINAFPGFRGVPGASDVLVHLIERLPVEAR
jgi:ribosomal protein S6--L-glutamate ligase